jgi:hypothetical protein
MLKKKLNIEDYKYYYMGDKYNTSSGFNFEKLKTKFSLLTD